MFFGDSDSSEEFVSPLTLSDLDLSPLKKVRFRSKSYIERELEFIEDPDYIPPSTPCSESYETEDMSLEETLSIGGSEEVRMVEEVSVGIESFRSKRTVEEVGGKEGVEGEGVEGEGVPSNILEVEGACERCYDVEVDIVSEVMGSAGVEERACSAPRDHWMSVYAHYLAAGLRFPISKLLVGLLLKYSICLTQLAPNVIRVVIGFLLYCRAQGVRVPTVNMFKYFLVLKGGSTNEKGCLNGDEKEEVEKLVREEDDVVDIMYLTSLDAVEATELYGANSLSEGPRSELKRKRSEDVRLAQKRMRVEEQECKGDEVVEFVPRPPLPHLFDTKSMTVAKRFINSTFPEMDCRRAREKVLSHGGVGIVKHVLMENEELGNKKEEVEKDLVEVMPELTPLEEVNDALKTKLVFEERKRRICEEKIEALQKDVKAQHPELDVTSITFGKQEGGVEEDRESMMVDFCLEVELKWDHDIEGCTIFPPNFDFKFIAIEKGEPEARSAEVGGAKVAKNELEQEVD
ncbi:hypothetical protein SLEP1_g6641 [Rubroshorea leprosula]|uniref:Transposase (putative) gypsy type domain-containing protein n=1 Tax=Rubroshorea leprosula TaxID=152421 RepID=A0AAV5I6N9_9ROSI|nr:hypothetical protein SLEP1_g6641 [Rubroshorea leprosula]